MKNLITYNNTQTPSKLQKIDRNTVIDMFLRFQEVKETSKNTYKGAMNRYFDWLEEKNIRLNEVQMTHLLEYRQSLIDKHHNTSTIRTYIYVLRLFYRWAAGIKLYEDIAASVKPPRKNQGGQTEHFQKMHLTNEQAAELINMYEGNPRNYALVNLMLRTGLRTIEVSRAKIKDITLRSGRRILQVWGKGMDTPDPSVYVILTDAAYGPIKEYLKTREPYLTDEYLFATEGMGHHKNKDHHGQNMSPRLIQMIIKNGLRAIGLDDHAYSAHSLRHTTGVQIIKNGGTLLDVKRTLRHSSLDTSMIYVSSIEEEQRLQNAPESLLDNSFHK